MHKHLIFLSFILLVASCGQKSSVKPGVNAVRLGDGENIPFDVTVPLTEDVISNYESSFIGADPIIKGIMSSIMSLGANMGAGKTRVTITQPLPPLPDSISSIKIKRIFFYLDTKAALEVEAKNRANEKLLLNELREKKLVQKKSLTKEEKKLLKTLEANEKKLKPLTDQDVEKDFNFLRRLNLKMGVAQNTFESYSPLITTASTTNEEASWVEQKFTNAVGGEAGREERSEELSAAWIKNTGGVLMIGYNQKKPNESLMVPNPHLEEESTVGVFRILQTTDPRGTRKLFRSGRYKDLVKNIYVLGRSIVVEIPTGALAAELFRNRLSEDAFELEQLNISNVNQCDTNNCLDVKVKIPDLNLVHLAKAGNGIKIDAYIDPKSAPKSFQLKGFIQFELKYKSAL